MYSASADVMRNLKDLRIVTDHLNATSVKVYCDGALGSRGAKLIEPYSDDTLNSGVTITDFDSLTKWAKSCYEFNFQLCVHSIGDAANRTTLKSMAGVLGGTNDRRWRIEHAQVVDPSDQALFGEFNILPSMQPAHTTSDMYWAEDRLGKNRISNAYAINTLKNQNGMIPLGTDFPVEDISPIRTFYAAVTRTDESGFPDGGFSPKEKLSREDALRGITIWPAIAGFNEDKTGSLEAGKFADLVILNRNILTCADREILSSEIIQTWINGKLVYEQ
jgi:predicted amidohydrolase YtcJ